VQVNVHIDLESGDLRCPRCFGKDLVFTASRGLLDAIMRRYGKIPRHCRFCGKRFYVPLESPQAAGWSGCSRHPGAPDTTPSS
jgi:hypothetical protein